MKTPTAIYDQYQRIFNKSCNLAHHFASIADPATGGNSLHVHNWGNDASKAVYDRLRTRWSKMRHAMEYLYDKAEHEQRHSTDFKPLWCKHCQGN